jgi:ATP-dependent metalloprotease FtsH
MRTCFFLYFLGTVAAFLGHRPIRINTDDTSNRVKKNESSAIGSGLINRKYPLSKPHYLKDGRPTPTPIKFQKEQRSSEKRRYYGVSRRQPTRNYSNDTDVDDAINAAEAFLRSIIYQNEDEHEGEGEEDEEPCFDKETGFKEEEEEDDDDGTDFLDKFLKRQDRRSNNTSLSDNNGAEDGKPQTFGGLRIIINSGSPSDRADDIFGRRFNNAGSLNSRDRKSENFEVILDFPTTFADVGGFTKIKDELYQCVDFLSNHTKYAGFNVRCPKGLILEGPPGNGKTLLAKAFAGEAKVGFIAVSGSEFQEKYVGVGSSRIRELFALAKKNVPCVIFFDEIDALGRKRSGDGETSSTERDSTLNELLVALDGFKNNTGVFIIGATNRIDLLDPALIRPGRIDKKIFVGLPDTKTREAIINIHIQGKPYDETVVLAELIELTQGLSGAQIENLLNEAMLNALRYNRVKMTADDIDLIMNKMMAGWQPTDHQFTDNIIDHIALHEMGHAMMGLVAKHHNKMTKVVINLSSPRSPAYTIFEGSTTSIQTREGLFEHLAILLAGRVAEEIFYGLSITTGALNDFEEALKLAEKMIVYYGMGKKNIIYPSLSDKFKEQIDAEVVELINDANAYAMFVLEKCKDIMVEGADLLKKERVLKAETLIHLIDTKYRHILDIQFSSKE